MENPADVVDAVRRELNRTPEFRYARRLTGILIVAQGMSIRAAANLLGTTPRTIANWLRGYRERGFPGLRERPQIGRPKRLKHTQVKQICRVIERPPAAAGIAGRHWSGPKLAAWIERQFGIHLTGRHALRLLHDLSRRGVGRR